MTSWRPRCWFSAPWTRKRPSAQWEASKFLVTWLIHRGCPFVRIHPCWRGTPPIVGWVYESGSSFAAMLELVGSWGFELAWDPKRLYDVDSPNKSQGFRATCSCVGIHVNTLPPTKMALDTRSLQDGPGKSRATTRMLGCSRMGRTLLRSSRVASASSRGRQ